jgi:capsular exopolysaccharide synthesis family protein
MNSQRIIDANAAFEHATPLKPKPGAQARLTALTDSRGLAADKFSSLAARLRQLQSQRSLKTVLVTSSGSGEGKSFVAANLAVTLARDGKQKVGLLEGDLREPSFGKMFGFNGLKGLSDYVQGNGAMTDFVYRVQSLPLWIIPAGTATGSPAELLQTDRLAGLLSRDVDWFDWVVIDSPPLVPWSDSNLWSTRADGTLLVVRKEVTSKKLLQSALENIESGKLLGVVLNDCIENGYGRHYGTNGNSAGSKV